MQVIPVFILGTVDIFILRIAIGSLAAARNHGILVCMGPSVSPCERTSYTTAVGNPLGEPCYKYGVPWTANTAWQFLPYGIYMSCDDPNLDCVCI